MGLAQLTTLNAAQSVDYTKWGLLRLTTIIFCCTYHIVTVSGLSIYHSLNIIVTITQVKILEVI